MEIRDATEADLPAITAIYNQVLAHSTAIYSDVPATVEARRQWWHARVEQGYPVLVAREGEAVAGFASFADFRSWPGYRFTVEGTVHLPPSARGKGTGTLLLQELAVRASACGKHMLIAGVDSENTPAIRFLKRFGFERAGQLNEVGYKFGRFLNLVLMQYRLTPNPDRGVTTGR